MLSQVRGTIDLVAFGMPDQPRSGEDWTPFEPNVVTAEEFRSVPRVSDVRMRTWVCPQPARSRRPSGLVTSSSGIGTGFVGEGLDRALDQSVLSVPAGRRVTTPSCHTVKRARKASALASVSNVREVRLATFAPLASTPFCITTAHRADLLIPTWCA